MDLRGCGKECGKFLKMNEKLSHFLLHFSVTCWLSCGKVSKSEEEEGVEEI